MEGQGEGRREGEIEREGGRDRGGGRKRQRGRLDKDSLTHSLHQGNFMQNR